MANNRNKGWCFTINNFTLEDKERIEALKYHAIYYVYGEEVGEKGTPHYQGFIRFANQRSMGAVAKLLPRAYLEAQRGGTVAAAAYCKKDGLWVEWGSPPADPKSTKDKWKWVIAQAKAGELESICDEEPGIYLRYRSTLISMRVWVNPILGELEHEWWYGPSGTGKSRKAWEDFPNHYQKELNKWWCSYAGEDVVVIEEWSPKNECTASALKIWADRYPFTGQIKGGSMTKIRPRKIIVTSNYSIEQCFPAEEDQGPLKRRFKQVFFPDLSFLFPLPEVNELGEFEL